MFSAQSWQSTAKLSVMVQRNQTWSATIFGKPLPQDHPLYEQLPTIVTSENICRICSYIEHMALCKGNDDDDFVDIVQSKGGAIKKEGTVSAYLDSHSNSICHSKCHLLVEDGGRCLPCTKYQPTLRAIKSNLGKILKADSTSHSSHTNYRYLEPEELLARMRNLQDSQEDHIKTK